jgi:hypothetical protein
MELDLGPPITEDDLVQISKAATEMKSAILKMKSATLEEKKQVPIVSDENNKNRPPNTNLLANQNDIDDLLRKLGDEQASYSFVQNGQQESYCLDDSAEKEDQHLLIQDQGSIETNDEKINEIREKVADLTTNVSTIDDTTNETKEIIHRLDITTEHIGESLIRIERAVEGVQAELPALRHLPSDFAVLVAEFQELRSTVMALAKFVMDKLETQQIFKQDTNTYSSSSSFSDV